jgi:hypothetical protein
VPIILVVDVCNPNGLDRGAVNRPIR